MRYQLAAAVLLPALFQSAAPSQLSDLLRAAGQGASQQPQTFRASTELVLVETQVVTRDGSPIRGLKADQFEVFIDGQRRPVVSAEFSGATRGTQAREGRVIVLAIDQASFPPRHDRRHKKRRHAWSIGWRPRTISG